MDSEQPQIILAFRFVSIGTHSHPCTTPPRANSLFHNEYSTRIGNDLLFFEEKVHNVDHLTRSHSRMHSAGAALVLVLVLVLILSHHGLPVGLRLGLVHGRQHRRYDKHRYDDSE